MKTPKFVPKKPKLRTLADVPWDGKPHMVYQDGGGTLEVRCVTPEGAVHSVGASGQYYVVGCDGPASYILYDPAPQLTVGDLDKGDVFEWRGCWWVRRHKNSDGNFIVNAIDAAASQELLCPDTPIPGPIYRIEVGDE